ncbi:hypothetical protein EDD21DRAFT_294182, partial [Dissophora ornata]
MQFPSNLRHLFATILHFCAPSDPAALWDEFSIHLTEDYMHRLANDPTLAHVQEQDYVEY